MEKYVNIHQATDQNKAINTKSQSLQQRVVMKFINSFKRTVWDKVSITCHMTLCSAKQAHLCSAKQVNM